MTVDAYQREIHTADDRKEECTDGCYGNGPGNYDPAEFTPRTFVDD